MKNIIQVKDKFYQECYPVLVPTDKSSEIKIKSGKLKLNNLTKEEFAQNYHLYIISNEEIKEGDWYFDFNLNKFKKALEVQSDRIYYTRYHCTIPTKAKKIILTTDQDLIKDGVQAIDDEFLEWFVNNPSCEFVNVISEQYTQNYHKDIWHNRHKIIIPKEESKQRLEKYSERFDNDKSAIGNPNTWGKRVVEEPKQELPKTEIDWSGFPKSTKEQVGFSEPNIIDEWLQENGNKEIAKQVEEEAKSLCNDLLYNLINLNKRAISENWKMKDVGEEFFKIFAYSENNNNCIKIENDDDLPKKSTKDRIMSETSEEIKQKARDYGNSLINKQETLEEASSRCAIQENKSSLYELGMKYFQLGAKWQQEQMYSEEQLRKVLSDIELVNPAHLTMLRSGYGEFPDSYELTEKGVDYIIKKFKKESL